MPEAKFKRECPQCPKVVRGTNQSILEGNYALHLKWHELNEQ